MYNAGNVLKLTQCVTVIVFGFFSHDDEVKPEHFYFQSNDKKLNYFQGSNNEMFHHIIEHFSPPGGTVLDLVGHEGTVDKIASVNTTHANSF